MSVYRNAFLIYNPTAGGFRGGRRKRLDLAVRTLAADGHRVTLAPTTGPRMAGTLARECLEKGADLVLAAGGDGTINEVIAGMAHSEVPLGVLPAGTANVLAREIRVGCGIGPAARLIAESRPRRIALGRLECTQAGAMPDRYFAMMAGIGFDAHIVYNLDLVMKSKFGQLAYWCGAARQIGRDLEEFDITVDGEPHRASFALASRVRNYAGYLEVACNANLLADDFEVALFEGKSAFDYYARYLPAIVARQQRRVKGLRFVRARRLCLERPSGPDVYIQVDGEYAGRLPATIDIVPNALTLLLPPAFCA